MVLGSGIRDPEKTYPGSRRQKGTGSQIRIHNTNCLAGQESKSWIAMGNMFLKLSTRHSRTMLAQDQVQLVAYRFIVWQGRRARAG